MDKERDKISKRISQWKATADLFLDKDIRVFIVDASENFYFGKILYVGDDAVYIKCFGPKHRMGEKKNLYWTLVTRFEEYQEE